MRIDVDDADGRSHLRRPADTDDAAAVVVCDTRRSVFLSLRRLLLSLGPPSRRLFHLQPDVSHDLQRQVAPVEQLRYRCLPPVATLRLQHHLSHIERFDDVPIEVQKEKQVESLLGPCGLGGGVAAHS